MVKIYHNYGKPLTNYNGIWYTCIMKWIKQKKGMRNCGQIAIAVATNTPYKKIVKLMKHENGTYTSDLVRVLRKLGYKCPNRLKVFKKNKPQLAIARLTYPHKSNYHCVAIDGNKIYDGCYGNKKGKVKWDKGWRITSYLPIKEKK